MVDESAMIEGVAGRLRFFFSDANLRTDKFLRIEIENNSDGYVPISTMLRFNTIKKISEDVKIVIQAAKHDLVSGRVKLNEDETAIARRVPFNREKMTDNVKLSLRVSNLPLTDKKEGEDAPRRYAVTMDEIKEKFSSYGSVELIKLQFYHPDWHNKSRLNRQQSSANGKAFVEFETVDELEKAVADLCGEGDNKPLKTLELGGNTLTIETMKKWVDERKSKKYESKEPSKKRALDDDKGKKVKAEEKQAEVEIFKLDWTKGHVISLKGLKDCCDREAILGAVAQFLGHSGELKTMGVYADFSRGQPEGAIRFHNDTVSSITKESIVDKVSELTKKLNDGDITIGDSKVGSAAILEGEEEESYYKKFIDFKNKQKRHNAEQRARPFKKTRKGGR